MNRIETPRNSHFHQTPEGIDDGRTRTAEFCWKTLCPAADGPSPTLGSMLVSPEVAGWDGGRSNPAQRMVRPR